jgi:hypothetical protein
MPPVVNSNYNSMKKALIIAGIVVMALAASIGIIFTAGKNPKPVSKSSPQTAAAPTPIPKARSNWDDPAGFTFTYDPDLTIDKHDEDQVNYAHIEMTNSKHKGTVIIWEKDTTAADAGAWVNTEKEYQGANVIDTTFAGQPGKKIVITQPARKMVTGTVYDGFLFYAETWGEDQTYWQNEYDSILASFTLKPDDSGTGSNNSSGSDQSSGDDSGSVDDTETLQ